MYLRLWKFGIKTPAQAKNTQKRKNSSRKTQLYRQFHTDYFIVLKKNHNSGGWEKLSLFTFQSSLAINPVRKSEGGPKASQSMFFYR